MPVVVLSDWEDEEEDMPDEEGGMRRRMEGRRTLWYMLMICYVQRTL